MSRPVLSTAILLLVGLSSQSCGVNRATAPPAFPAGRLENLLAPSQPPAHAALPKPAPVALAEASAAAAQPAEAAAEVPSPKEPTAEIGLASSAPALTETLSRALEMLTTERAENARLRETISSLEQKVAEKEKTVAELDAQFQASDARIQELEQSLEKWKYDVLGFRDEMRKAEEAEIEVLRQIVALLTSFKKEKGLE